jgi:hypothetical protein
MVNVRVDGIFCPSTGETGYGRGVTLGGLRGKRVVFQTDREALQAMGDYASSTSLTPVVKLERGDLSPDPTEGWVMDPWFPVALLIDRDALWLAVTRTSSGEQVEWRRLACDPELSKSNSGWFIPGPDYEY